jgi:hypothetical protein
MLPLYFPAGIHGILVLYIGTFLCCSTVRRGMLAFRSAASVVKEHPIKNATESDGQWGVTSVVSNVSLPFL